MERLEEAGIERVSIRSVLTCQSVRGVCARCYGRDLAYGKAVNIGEAIGIIAAQSIGEPGTQLTMRTFHIGGVAKQRSEQSTLHARTEGRVRFIQLNTVENRDGDLVVMNRNGQIAIEDDKGRERERYPLIYGTQLKVKEGQSVTAGDLLANWDPFTIPIITAVSGKVKFGDVTEGMTMEERRDVVTGKSSKVIVEYRDAEMRPRISIKDEMGRTAKFPSPIPGPAICLPLGAIILVTEGDPILAGDVIAKIPRETTKTKDITGGLPRVAELFEVRKPKEHAVITEIDGMVSFGKHSKGKRKVVVTPEVGEAREYLIPKGKHVSVQEGDVIQAGEALMDGSANPHDILSVSGIKELAKYLVNEVQEVYRLQGVKINDKHIEVIVRQMLRKVKIKDPGDTRLPSGRSGGTAGVQPEEPGSDGPGRKTGPGRAPASGDHQGLPVDGQLHLGGLLSGDHQGPDGCQHRRRKGFSAGIERKRYPRAGHPGRHRHAHLPKYRSAPTGEGAGGTDRTVIREKGTKKS